MAATNQESFSIQCKDSLDAIAAIGFYTEDENKICMITQEPIHQSFLDFCPDATLQHPFDKYNGIRLSCGHEFSAISLMWSWILNTMICPCCRDGKADFSACLSNVHRRFRPVLFDRKNALERRERIEQIQSDAALVMQSWGDMDMETQLVEPVVMVALYFYGRDHMYNIVLGLHRQGGESDQADARFCLQGSDLRSISRSIRRQNIIAFRFVVYSHDESGMRCIMRSPRIEVTPSFSASAVPNDSLVATRLHTGLGTTENVANMRTVGLFDIVMPLISPQYHTHTNEVLTTENTSLTVSQSGVVYDRRVRDSGLFGTTTNLCVQTVPLVGNVQVEFQSSALEMNMESFLHLTWTVPMQSLETIFPPTVFTVFQYNM